MDSLSSVSTNLHFYFWAIGVMAFVFLFFALRLINMKPQMLSRFSLVLVAAFGAVLAVVLLYLMHLW